MLTPEHQLQYDQAKRLLNQGHITEAFMLYQHLFKEYPRYLPLVKELASLAFALDQKEVGDRLTSVAIQLAQESSETLALDNPPADG